MKKIGLLLLLFGLVTTLACRKNDGPANPFANPALKPPPVTGDTVLFGPYDFAGLHRDIFQPTCSNSGCHDGTFEPDFRTIESSYNTMVYQPIIKNNPAGDYSYRVVPGNASASVLMNRLTVDIDGLSGIMPLLTDPNSPWPANKQAYIERIQGWINQGAKDVFGNPPVSGPNQPKIARP